MGDKMGEQSSRIIWGKEKVDSSDPQVVTIYDAEGTVYISGNYAIYADGNGGVSADYNLYLCTAAETGGDWNSTDWKLQKGVKNWYLEARRMYKKGARVIKSDTNGDISSLKLYVCKDGMSQPNVWKDSEWSVVYQDVGVGYRVIDHKDVYYNGMYHKLMYYLLPDEISAYIFDPQSTYTNGDVVKVGDNKYEYIGKEPYQGPWNERKVNDWIFIDDKITTEISLFDENIEYHYGDQALKEDDGDIKLFTFNSHTPRAGWDPLNWVEDTTVKEYEANVPYSKGDRCIRKYIEIYDIAVVAFQPSLRYSIGKYCLHEISKEEMEPEIENFSETKTYQRGDLVAHVRGIYEYNLNIPLAGPWIDEYWTYKRKIFFTPYRDRIIAGETIYGLYRSVNTVQGSWDLNDWNLIIDGPIQIKGHSYNTNGLCIMQFQIGTDYLTNDICIWTCSPDASDFGLCVAKTDIPNCSPAQAPPNSNNWEMLDENLENLDQYYVYKVKCDLTASENTHFQRENWLIAEQKIYPDDGLYGVIWEKYGKPGGGAGIPFGFPIVITGRRDIDPAGNYTSNVDIFYPYLGNSCLEIEKTFEASNWKTPCSSGVAYINNIVYLLASNDNTLRRFMIYSLTGFRTILYSDFSAMQMLTHNNNGIIYYDRLGYRMVNEQIDYHMPFGKIYKAYFGIDNIFGKSLVVDIPQSLDGEYCWFYPYDPDSSIQWNDPEDSYMYIYAKDSIPLLVKIASNGKMMNVPYSDYDFSESSYGACWRDTDLYERTFCYVSDNGDIVPLDYFKDIYTGNSSWTNGVEEDSIDEQSLNSIENDIYGGRMLNKGYYDTFPNMDSTAGGNKVYGVKPYSRWFDPDWDLFPNMELNTDDTEYYIGQSFTLDKTNETDKQVLNHLQTFCSQYNLTYYTEDFYGDLMFAGAKTNKYYKWLDAGWFSDSYNPTISKIGYAYKDRYGTVYILTHKTLSASYYSYDYEERVYSEVHIWGIILHNEFKSFYTYFNRWGGQYGQEDYKGELVIVGRYNNNILFGIRSGNTMSRNSVDLKTGVMTVANYPMYVELPYLGNTRFRIGSTSYSKARIYLGVNWSNYNADVIPPLDDDTFAITVPFEMYWTPCSANTGGVCHLNDLVAVTTISTFDNINIIVYIPQVMSNPTGLGGFFFLSGQSVNPAYGGPGENGFINK